jgi:hypothetical protein
MDSVLRLTNRRPRSNSSTGACSPLPARATFRCIPLRTRGRAATRDKPVRCRTTELAPRSLGDQSGEPERASIIQAKHLRLATDKVGPILLTELLTQLIPLEPELPAIG